MKFIYTLLITTALLTSSVSAQEFGIHGFIEGAYGSRIEENDVQPGRDFTLGETRLQLQMSHYTDAAEFYGSIDFLRDNIENGEFDTLLREAYFQFGLGGKADVKVGRQVLTWGTGDLVFINDLFPKDYISFFTGREDQYLKLASDAVKLRFFSSAINVDIVGIPFFDSDQMPTGKRLSFFNPLAGTTVNESNAAALARPDQKASNGEIAARFHRFVGNYQASAYVFRGFYKSPMGINPLNGTMYYPELSVYGASVRGPVLSGVLSTEYGYYDSRDDRDGDNMFIPNSQHRYLIGYEQQAWTDFTAGIQYYGELMSDFDEYERTLPAGSPAFDELRQVATLRMTQFLFYQTVGLSLFTFVSPTDEDWHVRPSISYKKSDEVTISVGGNFFGGKEKYTLFGQFEDNNNLYARLRYNF